MTTFKSLYDWFAAEEKRLARLKIFCAANNLVFYAAQEKIAEAVNNCAEDGFYLSTDEAQHRFMMAHRYGFKDLDLGYDYFWDLLWSLAKDK